LEECFATVKFDIRAAKQWSNCDWKRTKTFIFGISSACDSVWIRRGKFAQKSNRTVNPHFGQTSSTHVNEQNGINYKNQIKNGKLEKIAANMQKSALNVQKITQTIIRT
jgi:hypothetical protein